MYSREELGCPPNSPLHKSHTFVHIRALMSPASHLFVYMLCGMMNYSAHICEFKVWIETILENAHAHL